MSSTRFAPTSLTSKSGTQSLYVVPPFDVNPAIISRAANALSDSFDKVVGDLSASQSGTGGSAGTANVIAADMLTHQHLSKVFREVKEASDTYARLMGVQYPRDVNHATVGVSTPPTSNAEGAEAGGAEGAANTITTVTTTRSPNTNSNNNNQDRDGAHMFEFLIPYTWQQMQQSLQIGKNAGRTIGELRSDIAAIKSYWDNAYTQIQNDILPFMVRGAKILVLGEGRLISNVIETGLKFAKGAQFYVLEARPDLPHEELSQMHLGISGGLGTGGSPPQVGGSQQSHYGSSCCGARLVERVCRRTKGHRANMRLVPDSCAASILSSCNFVLMSAYAATKNGGIVHRAGSLQLASLAKVMNVPVYVVCESFKFRPIFPLSSDAIAQPSIPEGWKEQIAQHGGYNGVERVIPSYLPRTSAAAFVGIGVGIGGASVNYPPHQGGAFSPTRMKSVEGHSEPSFPASGLPPPSSSSSCGPSPIMLHGVSTTLNSGALVGLPSSSSSASCANHDAATVEGGAPPARTRANVRLNAATPSFGIVLGDTVPLSNQLNNSNSANSTDASSKFLNRLREENQHGHVAFHHSGTKNVSVVPVTNSGAPATSAAATAPISTEQTAVSTGVESAELSVEPLPPPKFLEFVPGDLITFFFTDRRILPPSGVVMDINQTFPLTQN